MPSLPAWIHGIPFARGLARLGLSLAPLFRRSGVAGRREKPFLLAALVAPFLLFVLPGPWRTPIGIAATLALAVWMLRGRTLRLHGAEHRAIAAVEERRLVDDVGRPRALDAVLARSERTCRHLCMPVTWLADRFWPRLSAGARGPPSRDRCRLRRDDGVVALRPGAATARALAPRPGAPACDDARADARRDARRPAGRRLRCSSASWPSSVLRAAAPTTAHAVADDSRGRAELMS